MYYTYVLKGRSNPSFYIGHTSDLKKRFMNHNQGKVSATRRGIPWKLIYYEAFINLNSAQDRELKLKQRGRAWQELKRRIDSA
jgi:putative endonuclease